MNKLIILIAGLAALLAVVAQRASANGPLPTNELPDEEDIDDELEGGGFQESVKRFTSRAAKKVGTSVEDAYGADIQNPEIGQATFAEPRKRTCADKTNETACKSCCSDQGKAYAFNGSFSDQVRRIVPGKASRAGCKCYAKDNNYSRLS